MNNKSHLNIQFARFAMAVFCYVAAAMVPATSQAAGGTFTAKYSFTFGGSTGRWPDWEPSRDSSAGYLYGITSSGGTLGGGTIYRADSSGNVTKMVDFGGTGAVNGSSPNGPLAWVTNTFYGVAEYGGTNGKGVLFKWTPGGSYSVVHHFGTGTGGASPSGPLIKATDGNLYGTTQYGGSCGRGTVFKLVPSTGSVSILRSFCTTDGDMPMTGVLQATNGYLYGTTYGGGASGAGTLFRVSTSGSFSSLFSFGSTSSSPKYPSRLMQAKDGLLYGTSYRGGSTEDPAFQGGTIFSSSLSGSVTVLVKLDNLFTAAENPSPWAALNEHFTGVFYGVSAGSNSGTVFQFKSSTKAVSIVHEFNCWQTTPVNGCWPKGGLVKGGDGNLWGATTDGETTSGSRFGTLFVLQGLTSAAVTPDPFETEPVQPSNE